MMGLAVGDALGTTLEFRAPGSFQPIDDMVGGGPFGLKPGQWTDDTSMALCLAESLVERNGFDPKDQLRRYVRWVSAGHHSSTGICFDIGNTISDALATFRQTGHPFCGSTDPDRAGNGSLMRLAPAPLFYAGNPVEAIKYAAESSRTTHGATAAVDACRYMACLIVTALQGAGKSAILSPDPCPEPGYWMNHPLVPEIEEIRQGSFRDREPPAIKGLGYVVNCLEAALWAFDRTNTFREGCLLAVNLGDDADTTGAVYGQLAGAFYGQQGIPESWRRNVLLHDFPIDLVHRLYDCRQPARS